MPYKTGQWIFKTNLKEKIQFVTETVIVPWYTVYILYGGVCPKGGLRDATEYETHRAGTNFAATRPLSGCRVCRKGIPRRLGKITEAPALQALKHNFYGKYCERFQSYFILRYIIA